jgi:hypothetical protein
LSSRYPMVLCAALSNAPLLAPAQLMLKTGVSIITPHT